MKRDAERTGKIPRVTTLRPLGQGQHAPFVLTLHLDSRKWRDDIQGRALMILLLQDKKIIAQGTRLFNSFLQNA
jgi:hypothetical protein